MTNETSNSGFGTGLAGVITGGIALLNTLGNGNGALLGGLLGGGNQTALSAMIAEKDSKIAELSAERYSDAQDAATYKQTLADNRNLREELYGFIKPIAEEAAANRERVAVLEATIKCENEKAILREKILQQKIDLEAAERKCCCDKNATAINALAAIIAQITKVGVPNSVLCPGVPAVTISNATTGTTPAA